MATLQPASLSTRSLIIKGELSADEDVTIDGTFEGAIDLPRGHLTMGPHSQVNAAVAARVVTVLGRLEGHITADLVDIGPQAAVNANIIAKQIALEDGGRFNGSVNTERARAAGVVARHRALQQQPPSR